MFTKSHLVAFGNYLLKTYGVQVHSSDGKNQPVYQREVTDADLSNWKDAEPIKSEYLRSDDDAVLQFTPNSTVFKCNILCVHTCRHIVKYDLHVWLDDTLTVSTRIYNVDSKFVTAANHEEKVSAKTNENLMREIIAKHKEHTEYPSYYHESAIAEMMEEYAKRKNS